MKRSNIFNEFVKIARDKGLISEDNSDNSRKALEDTGRADSLSLDDITKLYGVKGNVPKGMEYDSNIMEIAHSKPVVVAPSYDKINGLVENNIERQNVIRHFLSKKPTGQLFQQKYAKQLVLSLTRTANELDERNEMELMALADACLMQTSEQSITKNGVAFLAIGIMAAIAASLGAIYYKNHTKFNSDGFKQDSEKLLAEIDDLLNSNSNMGFGTQYNSNFISMLDDLKDKIIQFNTIEENVEPLLSQIDQPKDLQGLKEMASHPDTSKIIEAYNTLRTAAATLQPYLSKVMSNFSNNMYKNRQVVDKGFFSKMIDSIPGLHGGSGLVADDFDDVVHALETYIGDINDVLKSLNEAKDVEKQALAQIQQVSADQPAPSDAAPTSSSLTPDEAADPHQTLSNLNEDIDSLTLK